MASASILRARVLRALALACTVCLVCASSQGGEKIRFSNRSTKVDLPVKGAADLQSSFLLDFLSSRRSEMGAPDIFSFAPPRASRTARDKRDEERLEEKKNWIMQNAESLRGDTNRKEPADTPSEDDPGKERKTPTLMERFAEERDRKAQSSTNQFNNGFRPEVRSLDFSTRHAGAVTNRSEFIKDARNNSEDARDQKEADRPSERLPANARSGEAELPKSNGAGPSSGLSFLERAERQRQQEDRTAELHRLLASPGAVSAAPSRGVDLLNTPDATRPGSNPILGRGLNDGSSRLDFKKGFDPQGSSSRPSLLNDLIPAGFGSPGSGPVLLPTGPLQMERRPTVLPIPKRKI